MDLFLYNSDGVLQILHIQPGNFIYAIDSFVFVDQKPEDFVRIGHLQALFLLLLLVFE